MLTILRTQPAESTITAFLDAAVSLRDDKNKNIPGYDDIYFSMRTYEKIARDKDDNMGDQILLPINLFFSRLSFSDHKEIYEMYKFARREIERTTMENKREIQDALQETIFNTIQNLNLPEKMIEFCKDPRFIYPDLSQVGRDAHHTKEKTFFTEDYIEITAISILSKLMVPIWGEFIKQLGIIEITNNQRENLAFDLIEPVLVDSAFERIYNKLAYFLSASVTDIRKATDKKTMGGTTTSFILTHNGIDDQMFESIVMATIIVKRMATYECFTKRKEGNVPNAMVYIDDGIKKTADTRIKAMRNTMNTMPRRQLPQHDQEDNSSILDHASKTSRKPIDVPVLVTTAVQHWELPRLLEDTQTPLDVYNTASDFYETNPFDVSPLCQALVSSFIGTRFGGSKCIGYLPPSLYQKVVTILQIFLINRGMVNLAALISSKTSSQPVEGAVSLLSSRIDARLKNEDYLRCQEIFKGYLEKPIIPYGRKTNNRKIDVDRIDFVNHIDRMIDWLVRYTHSENMAPVLWDYAKFDNRPITGADCLFDETIVQDICRFYLMFHDEKKPF